MSGPHAAPGCSCPTLAEVASRPPTWMRLIAQFPSTNGRIVVSILLLVATGVRVLASWTAPPTEWLVFLTACLGIDVAQFGIKRWTHQNGATPMDDRRPDPPWPGRPRPPEEPEHMGGG